VPGASTIQLPVSGGVRGRNRLDTRGKDGFFARHGSAVIGPFYKCQ
jgi:hypothetical protein